MHGNGSLGARILCPVCVSVCAVAAAVVTDHLNGCGLCLKTVPLLMSAFSPVTCCSFTAHLRTTIGKQKTNRQCPFCQIFITLDNYTQSLIFVILSVLIFVQNH